MMHFEGIEATLMWARDPLLSPREAGRGSTEARHVSRPGRLTTSEPRVISPTLDRMKEVRWYFTCSHYIGILHEIFETRQV